MNRQEKQNIIASLKTAHEKMLKEQDTFRKRLAVMEEIGNKDYLKKVSSMGWDGIAKAMSEEFYPPTTQDRQKYLNQNWDEIPSRILVDQIEDEDIRHETYFLGEVVEHTQRIKALTRYHEVLGASPDDQFANMLFALWVKHTVWSQLEKEQQEVGNQEKVESLMQLADAIKDVFDVFSKNPEMYEKFPQ